VGYQTGGYAMTKYELHIECSITGEDGYYDGFESEEEAKKFAREGWGSALDVMEITPYDDD
jgi:hypothetical protein